jgi:three-Cys-motif partner protein
VVALRRIPRDLAPPLPDGRPYRAVHDYDHRKRHYWGSIVNAAARATKNVQGFAGRRACIDLFASYGINETDGGELAWGTSLLALHADDPFDLYVFGDCDPTATKVLAERIEDNRYFAKPVFALDLGSETLGVEIRRVKGEERLATKIVVLTGDANDAPTTIRALLPGWEGRRYGLALIDPPGADFTWKALGMLTLHEKLDLMMLFPEDMDIERNLRLYAAMPPGSSKLDRYMGESVRWREIVASADGRPSGPALRSLYKERLCSELGYTEIPEWDRPVLNSRNTPIYKFIFASKAPLGRKLWESANRDDPSGQIGLPIF